MDFRLKKETALDLLERAAAIERDFRNLIRRDKKHYIE